jgi:hypothetical protein
MQIMPKNKIGCALVDDEMECVKVWWLWFMVYGV